MHAFLSLIEKTKTKNKTKKKRGKKIKKERNWRGK